MLNRFTAIWGVALVLLALSATANGETSRSQAIWSAFAVSLSRTPEESVEVRAPNGRATVVVRGIDLRVLLDGKPLFGTEEQSVTTVAELGWAPESNGFYITQSDGGLVGTWYTTVFMIKVDSVRSIDVSRSVVTDFKRRYVCSGPEEPNVAAIAWLKDSERILLVAEVPPHSSCPEMGKIRGYIVEVATGNIIGTMSEAEIKAGWAKYMGPRPRS